LNDVDKLIKSHILNHPPLPSCSSRPMS
jgi:hypothetical protein